MQVITVNEILVSIVIMAVLWVVVYYWERKAKADQSKPPLDEFEDKIS